MAQIDLTKAQEDFEQLDQKYKNFTAKRESILAQIDNLQEEHKNQQGRQSSYHSTIHELTWELKQVEIEIEDLYPKLADVQIDIALARAAWAAGVYNTTTKKVNQTFEPCPVAIYQAIQVVSEYIRASKEKERVEVLITADDRDKIKVSPINFNYRLVWDSLNNALEAIEYYHAAKVRALDIPKISDRNKLIEVEGK